MAKLLPFYINGPAGLIKGTKSILIFYKIYFTLLQSQSRQNCSAHYASRVLPTLAGNIFSTTARSSIKWIQAYNGLHLQNCYRPISKALPFIRVFHYCVKCYRVFSSTLFCLIIIALTHACNVRRKWMVSPLIHRSRHVPQNLRTLLPLDERFFKIFMLAKSVRPFETALVSPRYSCIFVFVFRSFMVRTG